MIAFNWVLSLFFCFILLVPSNTYSLLNSPSWSDFFSLKNECDYLRAELDSQKMLIYCLATVVVVLGIYSFVTTILWLKSGLSKKNEIVIDGQQCNCDNFLDENKNFKDRANREMFLRQEAESEKELIRQELNETRKQLALKSRANCNCNGIN
jgi:hypothetical protein